jgi:hypothetical protein
MRRGGRDGGREEPLRVMGSKLAQIIATLLREAATDSAAGHIEEVVVGGSVEVHPLRNNQELHLVLEIELVGGVQGARQA